MLKGEASREVMHLGPVASTISILKKLDSIYGIMAEREDILAEFYSARQREDDECARWSSRLEDIISKAQQKGLVHFRECDEMLRTMFFKGLRPSLKDICGHIYDTCKCHTFDSLRAAVRKVEMEHQPPTKRLATMKSATSKEQPDDRFHSLEAQIQQLTTEVRGLKDKQYSYKSMPQTRQHYQKGRRNQGYKGGYTQYARTAQSQETEDNETKESHNYRVREPTTCYKCGQVGHVAIGCRVLVNHRRQSLNYNRSTPGDEELTQGEKVPGNRH